MNVLLIEPDVVQAQVIGKALMPLGHKVYHVASAQGAVHVSDEHTPDLIILEPQLPRHNGFEFLYEFRSYTEWQNIPVILHTMLPTSELTAPVLSRELGVVSVLHKPDTSLSLLADTVQALIHA